MHGNLLQLVQDPVANFVVQAYIAAITTTPQASPSVMCLSLAASHGKLPAILSLCLTALCHLHPLLTSWMCGHPWLGMQTEFSIMPARLCAVGQVHLQSDLHKPR